MNADFSLLAQKINELAELTHFLRRENAALRTQTVTLTEQNAELRQRMQLAHERTAALLARIPDPEAGTQADAGTAAPSTLSSPQVTA